MAGAFCVTFAPQDPLKINLGERLSPPNMTHLCGTDELGRDILSRILFGFSTTINVSIICLISSFCMAVLIGPLAGYFYDTIIDKAFNWIATMLFSLPFLLIIASVMSLLDKNLFNAYLVMTAIIWVSPARIIRSGIIKTTSAPFIIAERALGKSEPNILFKSLLPMTIQPAFVFSFKYFPEIIGMEAGLSFLGLGIQPPNPGLGKMVFDSLNYIYSAWWYAFFPAFFLFVVVLLSNLVYRLASAKALHSI